MFILIKWPGYFQDRNTHRELKDWSCPFRSGQTEEENWLKPLTDPCPKGKAGTPGDK